MESGIDKKTGGVCYRYFNNPHYTTMAQIITSFAIGVFLSPWSKALLLFVLFLVFYEIIYFYSTGFDIPSWRLLNRTAIIMASILGFITGRTITGFDDPVTDKNPKLTKQLAQFKPSNKQSLERLNLQRLI